VVVATRPARSVDSGTRTRNSARAGRRPPSLSHAGVKSRGRRTIAFVLGTIWLVVALFPIYYMVLASFRTNGQYLTANAWIPTGGLSFSSYSSMFSSSGIGTLFRNSAELAAGTIAIVVVLSLGAAYRIVRRGSRYAAVSFRLILFGLAVPIQAIVIPLYVITEKIHMYDTLYGLALVISASLIPVAVLLMVNYVRLIPRQLFDAMAVDGATEWTVFSQLVFPMARPVLAVVSIFAGLGAWNNFLLPLILTQSNNDEVLPLGLVRISTVSAYGVDVPVVMAAVLVSVLPLLFLYVALRRQFVKGIGGFALH
jgi:ABC-type glycerol-3-phosphate transport system permease component